MYMLVAKPISNQVSWVDVFLLTVLVAWADMYVSGSKMRSEEQVKRTEPDQAAGNTTLWRREKSDLGSAFRYHSRTWPLFRE